MLTPEQISALADRAADIAVPINDFLLEDIARRIKKAGQFTSSAAYQIWRAQQLGMSRKQVKKKLSQKLKVSIQDIETLLKQSAEVGYNFDIDKLSKSAVPFAQNTSIQQMVMAAVNLAENDFTNLTQTLGMVAPDGKAYPLQKAYRKACDFAFEQVFTGATDYNTAIRSACKNIADMGVRVIEYESGIHTGLEAAVRRNIMGGMGLMQEQISQYNHDNLGANGWEISAHMGSAPDHEPYQGRQYTDAEYTALNGRLHRRIGTLNCGHTASPIILGINEPKYSPTELSQMRTANKEGVTYQGRHYTLYEASQKQRQIERAIRQQKNRILVADTTGDSKQLQISQIRLGRLNDEYVRFSKGVGLKTRRERAFVSGFGAKQATGVTAGVQKLQQEANAIFSLGGPEANLDMYMKEKPVIDTLTAKGVKYKQRISEKEIIVDAGKPTIVGMRVHAQENLAFKADRADMTQEVAQAFVDNSKLTLYQQDRENLKFLAQEGYSIINLQHELVTAVPQKWRKKYNQYIEEVIE